MDSENKLKINKKDLITKIEEQIPDNAEITFCFSNFEIDNVIYHFDMNDGVWEDPKATGSRFITNQRG